MFSHKSSRKQPMAFAAVIWLCLIGAAAVFAQETASKSKTPAERPERKWHWKTGDEVFQLVTVSKKPTFKVQGLPFESKIRYKLLSRLTMRVSPFDNSLTIKQKVETTKLEEADELSEALLAKMLKDLTGKTITIRIDSQGDVTRIEGVPEPQAAAIGNNLDVRGVVLSSLIDRDGWKELAKATLFTPPEPLTKDAAWEEPVSHGWGPLGGWQGRSAYKSAEESEGLQTFSYVLHLRYQPPDRQDHTLPFKIADPMFRTKKAQGTLKFDLHKGRLSSMEETFHVAGQMTIQIAGQNLPLVLEEEQQFQLELFDKKPPPDQR